MVLSPEILIYILLGINLIIAIWLLRGEIRLKKLLRGGNENLESLLVSTGEKIDKLEKFQEESKQGFSILNEKISTSIRGVGLVRFNPFEGKGSGGNQSFAAAFLDEDGNGLVISSLYSRERVSTYSKPVEKFKATMYELSSEEKEAVSEAKKKIV